MPLPPLDEFMAIDPNSYLESVPGWGAELKALASDFTEYKSGVYAPGGTDWWGKTATAAQDKAAEDSKAIAAIHDTVDGLVSEVTSAVTYSVVPPLTNGHHIVDNARQSEGVTVNQDYTMTYSPPQGMSDEQADKNRQTVAAAAQELKGSADKWYSASQGVADQIHAAESKIASAINLSAVGSNGRAAVRAAAANSAVADIPSDLRNLKGLDPAATTPAGAMPGGLTDTLGRLPQDQPGAPSKDKLGKPDIPIPDQEVAKKDQKLGTTTGKGVDKGDDGKQQTPIGTSNKGKFGNFTKIEEPKGPTVWKGKTGEHSDELYKKEWKGHILGGDYDASTRLGAYDAGASAEVKKTGATAEEHAGAYAIDNKGDIHWDLGDNGSAGRIEAKIHGNAGVAEYGNAGATGNSGFTVGGGGNAGLNGGQELSYHSEPVDIKLGVEEYGGAGAGSHLTFAETEDHKWRVGGSWGYAWGLGAKPGFEVTVDPVVVGTKVAELWNWVMN